MNPNARYEYLGDMARIDRLSAPDISDRSYAVTANFDVDEVAEGVILAWGSRFGGFVLYINERQLCYEYVYSESQKHTLAVDFPQHPGKRVIQLRFERVGTRAGRASLVVDGAVAGALDIPRTWPLRTARRQDSIADAMPERRLAMPMNGRFGSAADPSGLRSNLKTR